MTSQDPIKDAFSKVKQDILNLQAQLSAISQQIGEIKRTFSVENTQTDNLKNQTDSPDRQTTQTVRQEIGGLRSLNSGVSIGNQGVQTDRQTNRQTDRHIQEVRLNTPTTTEDDKIANITKVTEVLESLDDIRKDLRAKFKKLTPQEMLVFSTIYQLQDQNILVNYSNLSSKTQLSESSIRDYVQKIIKKGIPVDKTKENNKKIALSIPSDFKKIAPLQTILALREL